MYSVFARVSLSLPNAPWTFFVFAAIFFPSLFASSTGTTSTSDSDLSDSDSDPDSDPDSAAGSEESLMTSSPPFGAALRFFAPALAFATPEEGGVALRHRETACGARRETERNQKAAVPGWRFRRCAGERFGRDETRRRDRFEARPWKALARAADVRDVRGERRPREGVAGDVRCRACVVRGRARSGRASQPPLRVLQFARCQKQSVRTHREMRPRRSHPPKRTCCAYKPN